MLLVIAGIFLVLWLVGFIVVGSGLIHILLAIAIIAAIFHFLGHRVRA